MSDIISSLIVPKSSQESFYSTQSQPSSPLVRPASQAAKLPLYDVDAFLNDPNNKALLSSNANQSQGSSSRTKQAASNISPPQPVQLGVKTSNHIVALYHLCQDRGLVPEFEIDGDQSGFGGVLKIGEQSVGSERKWKTKKEAKDRLAEKGVEVVRRTEAKGKSPAGGGGTLENWVGRLLGMHSRNAMLISLVTCTPEYQNAIDPTLGPAYTEYAIGPAFACTVQIPSHSQSFGSVNNPFSSKKAARSNAAREAIQFLISEGLINADGAPKARNKKVKLGTAVRIEETGMEVKTGTTYAQRINGQFWMLFRAPYLHVQFFPF